MKFHAMLEQTGKTSTGIRVPEEIVNELRAGKRPPVHVTIKGYTYRTTVAPMGGEFWIGVSAEVRERSGATGGDELDVEVVLDTEPREITVPPDCAEALNREAEAKQFFDGLSYSN